MLAVCNNYIKKSLLNQHKVLNVIIFARVCNQSEGRNIQSLRFDNIQFARRTDYIPLSRITYQAFGLDKNKDTPNGVSIFLAGAVRLELTARGFGDHCSTN